MNSSRKAKYIVAAKFGSEQTDVIQVIIPETQIMQMKWEDLRQFLENSNNPRDRMMASSLFSNRIIVTPQRLRESSSIRHHETSILLNIISAGANVRIGQVHLLARTGETDPEKITTFQMLTTKYGIIRQSALSKFPANNGRNVVAPGVCKFGTVVLPRHFKRLVVEDVFVPGMHVRHVKIGNKFVPYAGDMNLAPGDIVMRELQDGDPVIVNRQPTLHWRSMMMHRVKFGDSDAIGLHPCVTHAYNADFDGDEINIHAYPSMRAALEGSLLMNVANSFASSKRLYIGMLFHELTVLYKFSDEVDFFPKDFYYSHNGVTIAGGKVLTGRLCKKTIGVTSNSALYHMQYYGHVVMCRFVDDAIAFCRNKMQETSLTYTEEFLDEMIKSGGRGSDGNKKMLYDKIGDIFSSKNEKIEIGPNDCKFTNTRLTTINSCYKSGLSPLEVVAMSIPIRDSLIVAKTKISEAGALMNRLSIVLSSLVSDKDINLIYAGKIVSENMTFMYKYYNQEYDSYIDLRQLVYSCVVFPRLHGNVTGDIDADFDEVGIAVPKHKVREAPAPPKLTNKTTLRESFAYTPIETVVVETKPYNAI